jgi:DNA-binding response OmpR family regulator
MRTIIKKTLKNLNLGKNIFSAGNGVEGMNCLHSNHVDLAIVDWKMPVMNGAQMLDAIRSDRQLRDMPVIMVTAESEKAVVMDVAEIEVEGYLLKPLTPSVLDEKIRTVVDNVNHPDEATLNARKARACEEAGKLESAIRYMEMANRLKPSASRVVRNLGILYGKVGKADASEKYLLKAASVNSQDAVTRHLLSEIYWEKEEWDKAVEYQCEVLSLTTRFNENAIQAGETLLDKNLNALAIKLFTELITKTERNLPMKEKVLDLCMEKGELGYSKTLVDILIREFPAGYGLFFTAGLVYEAMGDEDKALEYFLEADKNHIKPVETKLKIARIYYLKKKIIQADNYLSQVLRLDSKNVEAIAMRKAV